MLENKRSTIVVKSDNSVYDGSWEVREMSTEKLANIMKQSQKKYRREGKDSLSAQNFIVEKTIKQRIAGWELENDVEYSTERLQQLIDNKLEMLLEILQQADSQLEKEFDLAWGN